MKKYLSTFMWQAIAIIFILALGLFVSGLFIIFILHNHQVLTPLHTFISVISLFFIFCMSFVIFYKKIFIPLNATRETFRQFIKNESYENLLNMKYPLFPELEYTLLKYTELLDLQKTIQLSTKQAEFLALQNQINPHFLYNTLEAIRSDAIRAGQLPIAETTEALSTFFRYTISDMGNLAILEDELKNVENYFLIQKYRFGNKIQLKFNISDNSKDVLSMQIPKLTLQPIVENAIYHGLERKLYGGTVTITFKTTTRNAYISVRDNGLGISKEKLDKINYNLNQVSLNYLHDEGKTKRGGIALINVCRRIKLLFGEDYGIHIFSTFQTGTDVRITLPYKISLDSRESKNER